MKNAAKTNQDFIAKYITPCAASILDAISDAVSIQGTDYKILYQNKINKDMMGNQIGEFCYKAYEKNDSMCEGCPLHKVFERGEISVTERSVIIDNKILHGEIKVSPLKDFSGKVIAGVEVVRDITERKKAEKMLHESKEFIEDLIESMPDGLSVISPKGVRIMVNRSLCDMTGFSKEELIGVAPPFPFWPPEHMKEIQEAFHIMKVGLLRNTELTFMRKNGERFPAIVSPSYMKNTGGEIINYIVVIRDITERKGAELELIKMKDELEERVKMRTQELESIIELLHNTLYKHKKAEETIKIHEQQLRTLMSKLAIVEEQERRRISEHIHDNIGQNLATSKIILDRLQEYIPDAPNGLKEARELIGQAINLTRSLTFELCPPILYELGLITTVEWLVEKVQERHGIKIEFKSDGNDKELKEEISVLLFRTIRELLNNIIKHSGASKAKISIHPYENSIEINVDDDGIGFDISEIDSYLIKGERFGILSIRERIKYLNGVFEIKSNPHEGTRVKIIVPLNQ
jgi:PAS domain S-box-containing protein